MHSGGFSASFYMIRNNLNFPCIALFISFLIGHIISSGVAKWLELDMAPATNLQ